MVREVTILFLLYDLINIFIIFYPCYTALIISKLAVIQTRIPKIQRPQSAFAGSLHVSPKSKMMQGKRRSLEPVFQSKDSDLHC